MKYRNQFTKFVGAMISGAFVFGSLGVITASAQTFPTKPIKIITPFSAGSGPDAVLRVVTEKMSKTLGQPVIIDNKPGAAGFIAIEAAKKSPNDGYTFLQADDAHISLNPHIFKKIPYDVNKDFDAVGTFFRTYFFYVTGINSPLKSVSDILAAAKAKPGEMTYGSWGVGSPAHIGGSMIEAATGTQMSHIPFKETPALFQAVAAGDVAWAFGTAGSAGPLYRAGKLKFLAVASPKRTAGYTDIPTNNEVNGPKDFEVKAWVALLAPRGTPADASAKVADALAKALAEPDVKEKFTGFGFDPFISKPSEMVTQMAADYIRYGEIAKRANIALD